MLCVLGISSSVIPSERLLYSVLDPSSKTYQKPHPPRAARRPGPELADPAISYNYLRADAAVPRLFVIHSSAMRGGAILAFCDDFVTMFFMSRIQSRSHKNS